jgi:dihydroorotate dehydrogenase
MSNGSVPTDPEEVRREIDRTRDELGDTVEALAHKVNVPVRVKERVHATAEDVTAVLRRRPLPFMVVAAGLVLGLWWLLRRGR